MPEYRSMLCCTDFSNNAERAFGEAAYLASLTGARLTLLHVIQSGVGETARAIPQDELQAAEAAAIERMTREYPAPEGAGFRVEVRRGVIAAEILEAAAEEEAEIIVMGARGLTFWEGFIGGGSVAVKVVHHSPIPVLVVSAHREPGHRRAKRP